MSSGKELIEIKENKSIEEILQEEVNFEPYTDIYETDDEFFLIANLPGVSRSGIRVKIEDGFLIIFGKVDLNELSNRKYILKETEIGNYFRRFRISENIETDKIEAMYENGQLIVKLPKNDRARSRTITIH